MLTLRYSTRRLLVQKSITARFLSTERHRHNIPAEAKVKPDRDGAWTVLKALEKAKEAQTVQVAQLVSSLEALLPRAGYDDDYSLGGQQHIESQDHTSDPAFFSLPEVSATLHVDELQMLLGMYTTIVSGEDVRQLLKATRQGRRVSLDTVEALLKAATDHFQQKPRVVTLPPLQLQPRQQLTVIGDLHGSLSDLEAVLGLTGEPHKNNILVFNGDLADRGEHGVEIIAIACALTLAYPDFVHINRGNHEDLALSIAYGLAAEVQHKYGPTVFRNRLGPVLDAFFCSLPLATVVKDDALIVHGGPPPPDVRLSDITDIITCDKKALSRTIVTKSADPTKKVNKERKKAQEVIEALLWSDPIVDEDEHELADYHDATSPDGEKQGWALNAGRGAGHKYDSCVIRAALEKEGLFRLVRSHEPVKKGCDRYVVDGGGNMEFFTVFSASRYPHKEGFNQGALLTLKPNGKHTIMRYATEEDEPRQNPCVADAFTSFDEENAMSEMCSVDSTAINRALQEAASTHMPELVGSLGNLAEQENSPDLPFDAVVDILIRDLRLEDVSGLKKPGAVVAFARALSVQCPDNVAPETIDLDDCIDALAGDEDNEEDLTPFYPWLHAVFEMVDVNHDGEISRAEWLQAVTRINAKLPDDTEQIDAEATWELLDLDGDGSITVSEWDQLGKGLCR